MDEHEQAVIDWVNSFGLERQCAQLSELTDGTMVGDILHKICPEYFDSAAIGALHQQQQCAEDWTLAAKNIRRLLRMLEGYFQTVLLKRVDVSLVDANEIVRTGDLDALVDLLELVVGAAVMCDQKATFISSIFELGELSQAVLKGLVEQVMARAEDLAEEEVDPAVAQAAAAAKAGTDEAMSEAGGDAGEGEGECALGAYLQGLSAGDGGGDDEEEEDGEVEVDMAEFEEEDMEAFAEEHFLGMGGLDGADADRLRVNEMLQHLQSERQRLLDEVSTLEQSNDSLKVQLDKVTLSSQQMEQQRMAAEGSDRSRVFTLEQQNAQLQAELDELRREHDLSIVESESLQHELKGLQQRLEQAREVQAKLEMETHQQADELDLAKDKVAKLARAEQTVEKYQKKLLDMVDLRRQNKELSDRMDQYLDQIHDLESANKGLGSMNKVVEQYKNRAVELETQKFEAISNAQMREQQVVHLTEQLDKERASRRQAQDECASLRLQLEQLQDEAAAAGGGAGLGLEEDSYQVETVPLLKEKVKKLERELRETQMTAGAAGGTGAGSGAGVGAEEGAAGESGGTVVTATATAAVMHEVVCLRQELEDVRNLKKEREEALLVSKKQLAEAQHQLKRAQEDAAENGSSASLSAEVEDVKQQLAASVNTVKLLQERLKERETAINKVEQEKNKLENYTKRSLGTFKDKYMAVLHTLKEEKEELQQKMRAQAEKSERNQDTWHREERLISSAMYELGVRIMDSKIQAQMTQQGFEGGGGGGILGSPSRQQMRSSIAGTNSIGRKLFSPAGSADSSR